MRLIDRYIGAQIAKGYLVVLLALLAIFSFAALVEELDGLGKGSYGLFDVLLFVALTTPKRALDLIGPTALLGTVLALGSLAASNELLAMRAAGVSLARIASAALKTGLTLMLLAGLGGEYLVPLLEQRAHVLRARATAESTVLRSGQGFWSRDGRRFVNVRDVLYGRVPADLNIYEFDGEGQLRRFVHAARGEIRNPHHWLLTDVDEKLFDGRAVRTRHHPFLVWEPFVGPSQIAALMLPVGSLAPSTLYRYVQWLRERGEDSSRHELMLWRKLAVPLTIGIMVLIAVPFACGSPRAGNLAFRVMLGALVGVGYSLLNQISGHLGLLLEVPAPVTVLAPVAVMGAATLWLFRRARSG